MKRTILGLLLVAMVFAIPSQASIIVFNTQDNTNNGNYFAGVEVRDGADSSILNNVEIRVLALPLSGSLTGIFLELGPGAPIPTLAQITGNTAAKCVSLNGVGSCGSNSNNMNGGTLPQFDIGVEMASGVTPASIFINTPGFTASNIVGVGLRIQSIVNAGTNFNATSSKTYDATGTTICTDCQPNDDAVPEPATYALLGSALMALGAIRRLRG